MNADLVCLVADKNIEAVVEALLKHRTRSLGIRPLAYEVKVHPRRDPGCLHGGAELLQGLLSGKPGTRGLLVFDQAFDGNPHRTSDETEQAVRKGLRARGLADRAEVVVIEPEIEAWVFSGSRKLAKVLGWSSNDKLRAWLCEMTMWPEGAVKPPDPKAAMQVALYEKRIPRSSALYRRLAEKVSLRGCADPAFGRLSKVLQRWFGQAGDAS